MEKEITGIRLMDGNQAAALGAYWAGCRFFAGYPITPATSAYNALLNLLPPSGGAVIQAEDEIAAIGYCLGASMTGVKAMTATSGPGISLYSEQISFAIAAEIPLVILNVQRLGPSTGAATRGADGDIQFMQWGNSGGMPVIVLSPADASECLSLTMHAFNLSEKYRTPVFVASNKEIGMTEESIDFDALVRPPVFDRLPPSGPASGPFEPLPGSDVPGFLPVGGEQLARFTSSAHGPDGYLSTLPDTLFQLNERLKRKIDSIDFGLGEAEYAAVPEAKRLIVTYGVTTGAARIAVRELNAAGYPVSFLRLKTLWPVPESIIREAGSTVDRVIVVEMNQGQYVREVERVLGAGKVKFAGRMDGTLISSEQIKAVVHNDKSA
jgi:2-oxoglutarate ferredoxin oxidoreductase subunit alpha